MAIGSRRKWGLVSGAGSSGPEWGNGKATALLFAREGQRSKVLAADLKLDAAVETLCCTDQQPGADSPRQRHLWEAAHSCDRIGRRCGRQRGRFCRANDAPLWAAAAANYSDFEAFDKTISCHSSPDPGQPFFNLIICRARLSPGPG